VEQELRHGAIGCQETQPFSEQASTTGCGAVGKSNWMPDALQVGG
jgi:hypothetical protein